MRWLRGKMGGTTLCWVLTMLAGAALGCRTSAPRAPAERPLHYPLQAPASYGGYVAMEQVLTARMGRGRARTAQMHMHVTVTTNRIQILGLSPLASPWLAIQYDGRDVEVEPEEGIQAAGRLPLEPESILSDMQLVFWPQLPDVDGWRIEETTGEGQARVRRVRFHGELMAEITYPESGELRGVYELVHHRYRYQLTIRNVNVRREP